MVRKNVKIEQDIVAILIVSNAKQIQRDLEPINIVDVLPVLYKFGHSVLSTYREILSETDDDPMVR